MNVARTLVTIVVVCTALLGCKRENRYAPPPPPEVTVSHPLEQEVTTYLEFTGHTAALEAVDIRARVQGYLKSIHFTPGADVLKSQLLFEIEPELYAARLAQAKADLEGKQAQYRAAQAQYEITEAIFKRSAGSRTDLVQKGQQRDLAKAAMEMARATVDAAALDLSYTQIYAPIDGRIDRNRVDAGNLVGAGEPTLLASMVRDDPIYVYFTASERELLQYREFQRQHRTFTPAGKRNVAYLGLATDTGYPYVGEVDYASNRVDPDTGTVEARAIFPNPDRVMVPGLFARVRLPFLRERSLLVPEVAIGADQGGSYVLIVDDKNAVQYRRVQVGATVGEFSIVRDGVAAADSVIIKGQQRARPGTVVKPLREQSKPPELPAPNAPTPVPTPQDTPAPQPTSSPR
jgi:RND family efflux transporter MFP subunit